MTIVYQVAVIFLLVTIGAGLIRILRGPTPADRLLAVQLFGTTGTAILILLSMESNNDSYKNVALAFALLAGILGVAFTRYGPPPRAAVSASPPQKEPHDAA
jgi:multicomponent Na+:H+ antiporter subunit F